MRFKFIGDYTNNHTSISIGGVTFEEREPSEVPDNLVERFSRHPEFEVVENEPKPEPTAAPKPRGRKKAAQ